MQNELREKLTKIMGEWALANEMHYVHKHAESLADALIEAGLKFKSEPCQVCKTANTSSCDKPFFQCWVKPIGKKRFRSFTASFCPNCGGKLNIKAEALAALEGK